MQGIKPCIIKNVSSKTTIHWLIALWNQYTLKKHWLKTQDNPADCVKNRSIRRYRSGRRNLFSTSIKNQPKEPNGSTDVGNDSTA